MKWPSKLGTEEERINKLLAREIELSDNYKYQIQENDLRPMRDAEKKLAKKEHVHIPPQDSLHMLNPTEPSYQPEPIIFKNIEEHRKFHNFNPLSQSLVKDELDGTYYIKERKQIVDVDPRQRPRVVTTPNGNIPFLFSQICTPNQPTKWKKRW